MVVKKIFVIGVCMFAMLSLFSFSKIKIVQAKEESVAKTDLIWQKERLEEEIIAARQKYSEILEVYRTQERLYSIAYDQYSSLKTLAALEDLVLKTKSLAMIRDEVLSNYLELIKLNLYAVEGVELSIKTRYLDLLDEQITALQTHKQVLESKTDQDGIELSLKDFTRFADLPKLSEQVLALLAVSRLQRIYDLSIPLKQDIDKFLVVEEKADTSALVRASIETDKSLTQSKNNLDLLWEKSLRPSSLENIYSNLTRDLNPAYISLSQSLSYLKELLDFN